MMRIYLSVTIVCSGARVFGCFPNTQPRCAILVPMSVWFVTGASRGFGAEIVEKVLAAGHSVAATCPCRLITTMS
ncbi:MAG: hypothetical protein QOK10_1412 [Pseudonocardiales bacterium]|nr:hypothetical protein [Pseudonocardiales bacterium]